VTFEKADNWYTRGYTRVLRWALGHRALTLLIAAGIFVASIFILPLLGTSFLPTGGEKMVSVEIQMPYGNDRDLVQKIGEVEQKIDELGQEEGKIRNYYAYLGSLMGEMERGIASIQIELSNDADIEQQADALRQKCQLIPETLPTTIKVTSGGIEEEMMGVGSLEVRVIGDKEGSLEPVQEVTKILTEKIQALETKGDIENLESALVINKTDVIKEWTNWNLALAATGQASVEDAIGLLELEWAMMRFGWPLEPLGQTSPTVEIDGVLTEMSVPGIVMSLSDINTVKELRIGAASPVKLGDLADVDWGPAEYHRAEGGYAGTIVARIAVDDVGAVNQEVQEIIDSLELPDGVSEIKMGGIAEQMKEGFSDMFIAIAIAIGIVFIILVISFRSWLMPLLIMVSMPLATIGVVLALLVTGKELGMSAMIGILMLVGIVLTNAIVLLTFVDDRRKEGYGAYDALIDAGRIRLRPILMTAITTMIALVPLALGIGEGVLMAAELGVVVIGGLFSSTLLTLLVIPVLYSLTERLRRHAPLPSDSLRGNAGHLSNL
jgi:HAE1 family hydrophobic/amphiphilic exporter-1